MDHGNTYHKLQNDTPGGVGGFSNSGNPNMDVLNGLFVDPYRCPSSTVPQWASINELLPGDASQFLGASYVGISGAAFRNGQINPDAAIVDTTSVTLGSKSIDLADGTIHGVNGVLLQNECVSLRDIRDGTTVTMLVAEQSSARFRYATPSGP